jgi:hypothetical protein
MLKAAIAVATFALKLSEHKKAHNSTLIQFVKRGSINCDFVFKLAEVLLCHMFILKTIFSAHKLTHAHSPKEIFKNNITNGKSLWI